MPPHPRASFLLAFFCLPGAASASRGRAAAAAAVQKAFFANDGRRASSWTLSVQLSSAPEDHRYRYTIPRSRRSSRRSANVALTRRTVEQLRGGSDGRRPGGGDDDDDDDEEKRDPYYGYNNYQDDRDDYYRRGGDGGDRGGYYSFGGDYNDNGNSGQYGGSSQSMNDDQEDDYRSYYNNNDSRRRDNDNVGRERRGGSFDDDDERYREDDYGYNQYDDSYSRNKSGKSSSSSSPGLSRAMPRVFRKGNKKYGMMMLGSGTALTALGMTMFFNKGLMRLGNLLFVGGVPMFIGATTTMKYFLNPAKARATGCVVAGVFLVFVGWPILGILMELFGLLNLFGNMFPLAMYFVRSLPFFGNLFPKNDNGRPKSKRRDYDDYDPYERYHDGGEGRDYGDDDGYGGGGGGGGGYY